MFLPGILLLCAWWQRGRIDRRDIARTLPFFLLALAMGLVTVWFQHHRGMAPEAGYAEPLAVRFASAGWAIGFYLYKAILPLNLTFLYPLWEIDPHRAVSWLPWALLIAAGALFWRYRRSWGRPPLFALGCYICLLLPALGFIQMAFRSYAPVSDHLHYAALPAILALAAGLPASRWPRRNRAARTLALTAAILGAGLLGWLTWEQSKIYRSDATIWADIHAKNDRAWVAHERMARSQIGHGRKSLALYHLKCVVDLRPDYAAGQYNLGVALVDCGHADAAVPYLRAAVRLKPEEASFRAQLDRALRLRDAPDGQRSGDGR